MPVAVGRSSALGLGGPSTLCQPRGTGLRRIIGTPLTRREGLLCSGPLSSSSYVRSQRVPSNSPAAGAGPPQRGACIGGRRMRRDRLWGPWPHGSVQTPVLLSPHAGLDISLGCDPALAFYPGARGSRGPQRLCSLDPDTSAAAPPSSRSRKATLPNTVRAARVSASIRERAYATFRIAPAGTTPVVTYRHSAITSWRATATMPIRRARFPVPKCSRYHCVRALCGCQRTQFHAS